MSERWEDEDDAFWCDDENFDCDCSEEEVDILDGTAHCWRCGNRRILRTEEFKTANWLRRSAKANGMEPERRQSEFAPTITSGRQSGWPMKTKKEV